MKPWDRPGWFGSRVREAIWQGCSWGYMIALLLTWVFVHDRNPITLQAMFAAWGLAFLKRGYADYLKVKNGGPPPSE